MEKTINFTSFMSKKPLFFRTWVVGLGLLSSEVKVLLLPVSGAVCLGGEAVVVVVSCLSCSSCCCCCWAWFLLLLRKGLGRKRRRGANRPPLVGLASSSTSTCFN